jgi:hypothetical protein
VWSIRGQTTTDSLQRTSVKLYVTHFATYLAFDRHTLAFHEAGNRRLLSFSERTLCAIKKAFATHDDVSRTQDVFANVLDCSRDYNHFALVLAALLWRDFIETVDVGSWPSRRICSARFKDESQLSGRLRFVGGIANSRPGASSDLPDEAGQELGILAIGVGFGL